MRNIQGIKKQFLKKYANSRCHIEDATLCKNSRCICNKLASVQAYIYEVIPNGHESYNIFDFQGLSRTNKKLLSNDTLLRAKNEICRYCWNKSWEEVCSLYKTKEKQKKFFREHSFLDTRLSHSNNVVIYSDHEKPSGRTMASSIIMKEAIKLRLKEKYIGHTYDWIDFSLLMHKIRFNWDEITELYDCTWLVVDNINITDTLSYKQQIYFTNLFNPFLLTRLDEKNLVTILVIKDDIMKTENLQETFGLGVTRFIEDKNTFNIPLCETV